MTKSKIFYGLHAVKSLLKHKPQIICHLYLQKGSRKEKFDELIQLAEAAQIPLSEISLPEIIAMVGEDVAHQGALVACYQIEKMTEKDLQTLVTQKGNDLLLLILDGVQDPHNLGACLRTANAMGVDAVIAPRDKAVGLTPVARKVASGAAEITPFIQVTNLARTLRWLQQQGIWLIGAAVDADLKIDDVDLSGRVGIVMGFEGKGLRRLTKEHCDFLAKINMIGVIESLNVSVATGMFLYEVQRQRFLG